MSPAHSPTKTPPSTRRNKAGSLLLLLFLTALLRGAGGWALAPQLAADPDSYRLIAHNLVNRGSFSTSPPDQAPVPTAYRPPIYPWALACCAILGKSVSPVIVGSLHVALGMATVGLTWYLGQCWGLARGAILAAFLTACDPLLWYQSSQVMTETMATFLVMLGLVALTRLSHRGNWQSACFAGVALGLSSLCRPSLLAWFLLSCGACLLLPVPRARKLACLAVVGLTGVLVLAPWIIRNTIQFHRPIVTTTHGGYTLHLANNSSFYRHLETAPWGKVWEAHNLPAIASPPDHPKSRKLDPGDELNRDRLHYKAAWDAIRNQPSTFAWSCAVRWGRLWRLAPHQTSAAESLSRRALRWAVGLWYTGLFCLAVRGLWKLKNVVWKTAWLWGILLTLALTTVHTCYWSNVRMRAPVTPFLCLLAATGTTTLRATRK
ncbi:MAG: glycosyltransferase family 39 protein [Planctomycetota bacterium]|nr:glycosyltransferase family 39 protein [Planctomycetota bacterium]